MNDGGFGGDQVAETISGIIATNAIFVRVFFEDVFRTIGIVLEIGQTFD